MSEALPLLSIVQKFLENDPPSGARLLEGMEENDSLEVLKAIEPELSARLVRHLPDGFVASLLQKLPYPVFRKIIELLDPQQAAAVFFHFPEHLRELFLIQLEDNQRRKEIQEILTFPEGSAGRLMTTDFLALHADLKVSEAVQKIREVSQRGAMPFYVYVVDAQSRLVGVMNMRDMLLVDGKASLESVMRRDVFSVEGFRDREDLIRELSGRRYFAVPVVDNDRRLLGVVKAEQLIGGVQEEASEDLQKMFGAGADERTFSPMSFSIKKRLPWLQVNLATAFLAAWVVSLFQGIIAKITVLAVYLPVVAGQGGNAGAQSLAVVMRGLVMRASPPKRAGRLVLKECFVGLINGLVTGIVTAAVAWFWQGNPWLGLVIGLGMVVNLTIAGFSGAAIPLIMKEIGLDPAQCSNIILTTITDVMGFLSFLGFAVIFQSHLM